MFCAKSSQKHGDNSGQQIRFLALSQAFLAAIKMVPDGGQVKEHRSKERYYVGSPPVLGR